MNSNDRKYISLLYNYLFTHLTKHPHAQTNWCVAALGWLRHEYNIHNRVTKKASIINISKKWLLNYLTSKTATTKRKGYKPMLLDTDSLRSAESSIYPSLALSDRHLPCLLKRRSGTPAFAAAVAPPALRLILPLDILTL